MACLFPVLISNSLILYLSTQWEFVFHFFPVLSQDIPHIFALTLFEDYIYWTDWETKSINRAHKTTGANKSVLISTLHRPMDIHIFHAYRQPDGEYHAGPDQLQDINVRECVLAGVLSSITVHWEEGGMCSNQSARIRICLLRVGEVLQSKGKPGVVSQRQDESVAWPLTTISYLFCSQTRDLPCSGSL